MGNLWDAWQQNRKEPLREELENLKRLANFIRVKNVAPVYFTDSKDNIRDRIFGDFLIFVRFLWGYKGTLYNDPEEISQEFRHYIDFDDPQPLFQPHSPEIDTYSFFAFKSPLVFCVVDRLCIIDGRRGHIISPLMDIYVATINKLFAKNDYTGTSYTTLLFDNFIKQCDEIANKIVSIEAPSPTPIDQYELPPFTNLDNAKDEEDTSDSE